MSIISQERGIPNLSHDVICNQVKGMFFYNTLQKSFPVCNNKREFCRIGYSSDLFNLCFCFCFSVLTAVVIVNESVEKKNSTKLTGELKNAGLTSVKESLCQRYLTKLISAKQEKAQVGYMTVFVFKGVQVFSVI